MGIPPRALLIMAACLLSVLATAQNEAQLSASFVDHLLVLRNNYTDAHLSFDSKGKLTSQATAGYGPNEGRLYVDRIMLDPGKLMIVGNRPIDIYDENQQGLLPTKIGHQVVVEVELPSIQPAEQVLPKLLEEVFYTAAELDRMKCSDNEKQDFSERLQRSREVKPAAVSKKRVAVADAKDLDELPLVCYPIGDRAYPVGRGIMPPKSIKSPTEDFFLAAQHASKTGVLSLMVIVDTNGRPTSLIVSRALGSGLDEEAIKAVGAWTFKPATFQGKPVPVAVNVDLNTKPEIR